MSCEDFSARHIFHLPGCCICQPRVRFCWPVVLLQVAQALLAAALQPPLRHMTARQLYQLLQAAGELGAAPSGSELQQVQAFLSS